MFWYRWSSWTVELLGGAGLTVLAYLVSCAASLTLPLLAAGLAATAGSVVYELSVDSNGWSWADVGQRQLGVLAGLAVLVLVL
jgi:hypothetical protein